MFCPQCDSQQYLGKGLEYEKIWCPNCEGFEVLSRDDSVKIFNGLIKEEGQEIKRLINLFETDSLLTTLFVTREGYLLPIREGRGFDSFAYVSLTDLISKILRKESKGSKECKPFDMNFQRLIHIAKSNHKNLRLLLLVKKNLGSFIRVPSTKAKDIIIDFETAEIVNGTKIPDKFDSDVVELFKFYDDWKDIMDNFNANGFISSSEAYINQINKTKFGNFVAEHIETLKFKTSLELTMKDHKLFEQEKFENNLEYISLLDELSKSFDHVLTTEKMTPLEFTCFLRAVSKNQFESVINNYGFDYLKAYDLLVSRIGDKTNFPLIYEHGNKLLVPPLTLHIFEKLLNALYSQELQDNLAKEGYVFEDKVCKILEDIGLRVDQPNDCTKKLTHIEDYDENGKFEIDIVAYNYQIKKLFVIDCKHIFLTSDFIFGKREQTIIKKLKGQPDKQKRRIEYIKNNLQSFGLNSKKIKKYVSVLITVNKEPIDILDNCHIISIREIDKIKDLEPL